MTMKTAPQAKQKQGTQINVIMAAVVFKMCLASTSVNLINVYIDCHAKKWESRLLNSLPRVKVQKHIIKEQHKKNTTKLAFPRRIRYIPSLEHKPALEAAI